MKKIIQATKEMFSKRDPTVYEKAEKVYKTLDKNVDLAISSLEKIIQNIDSMSKGINQLARHAKSSMDNDHPQATNQINCILLFSEKVNHITEAFFDVEIYNRVMVPLQLFSTEMERMRYLYKKRKKALKKANAQHEKCLSIRKETRDKRIIEPLDQEAIRLNQRFYRMDEDFVKSVERLKKQKFSQVVLYPSVAISQIFPQYLRLIFKEMADLRTAFPPQIFVPNCPIPPTYQLHFYDSDYINNAIPVSNPYETP